jgi:phage-related protein
MGQGLWELKRLFEGVQYRIFFCANGGFVWLLHAIEKKSSKTPLDDLRLARKRMRGCMS